MGILALLNGSPPKIDDLATLGLDGVEDSLAYRVHEIERHLHNNQYWFGAAAIPDGELHVADRATTTAFQATAGNDTWGSWLQIVGSEDTVVGDVKFDLNRILVEDVPAPASLKVHLVQIGHGASGAAALSAGDVTEIMFAPERDARSDPYTFQSRRIAVGEKVWLRHWASGQNAPTMDFFYSRHGYQG